MLVACPDVAAYDAVVAGFSAEGGAVPVFASAAELPQGFPPGTEIISFAQWQHAQPKRKSRAATTPADPSRLCISVDHPACAAVSRLLRATGRRAAVYGNPASWEKAVRRAVAGAPLRSLTFIVPTWGDTEGHADAAWIARIIVLMRSLPRGAEVPWGIITGADPAALSLVAAKGVLQGPIAEAYRTSLALLFSTEEAASLHTPIAKFTDISWNKPLVLMDHPQVANRTALAAVDHPLSVLLFNCHGRSYCAADGYLCAARRLEHSPAEPPASCVMGLECYGDLPQIDPRRFDTPVMVLDSCGTGNWASVVWQTGVPSVAFFALAGAPSAVLTGDGIAMVRPEYYSDVLWALISARTMGEATMRLNAVRREVGVHLPYYLLGDPEIAAGAERWPEWSRDIDLRATSTDSWEVETGESAAPFLRIRLPRTPGAGPDDSIVFLRPAEPDGPEVQSYSLFSACDEQELWIGQPDPPPPSRKLLLDRRPSPALPRGLAAQAHRLPREVLTWKEPHNQTVPGLLQAAERVTKIAFWVERHAGAVSPGSPDDADLLLAVAVDGWLQAHENSLKSILTLSPGGLWPYRLWSSHNYEGEPIPNPCPHCGLTPTIRRRYLSHPGSSRQQWECLRCEIIHDLPGEGPVPGIDFHPPERLAVGSAGASIELHNEKGDTDLLGAGAILVEGRSNGVASSPHLFRVHVPAGTSRSYSTTLTLAEPPKVEQLYRIRSILLLNGHWMLASRLIPVRAGEFVQVQTQA
jgi:hypothetical protein